MVELPVARTAGGDYFEVEEFSGNEKSFTEEGSRGMPAPTPGEDRRRPLVVGGREEANESIAVVGWELPALKKELAALH